MRKSNRNRTMVGMGDAFGTTPSHRRRRPALQKLNIGEIGARQPAGPVAIGQMPVNSTSRFLPQNQTLCQNLSLPFCLCRGVKQSLEFLAETTLILFTNTMASIHFYVTLYTSQQERLVSRTQSQITYAELFGVKSTIGCIYTKRPRL